jgi:hypothetical protein
LGKISINFSNFDVPSAISSIDVNEKAKADASYGYPLVDATAFTATEIEIEHQITSFYSNSVANCNATELEESLQNSASLRQADGHDGQISSLNIDLVTLYAECKSRIVTQHTKYVRDRNNLNFFRRDNGLVEPAHLRTGGQKSLAILVLVGMFTFEASVNTSLMMGAISGGLQGALALAGVIAFVNIVSSFIVGRLVVPNMYHKTRSRVTRGVVGFAVYAPVIIYINFTLGVFRSLSSQAKTTFSTNSLQEVALKAAWPFDNLGENTLESNGLIIIGLLFAIIAVLDGMFFDEMYPGYAKVSTTAKESEEKFEALKQEGFDLLQSKQTLGNNQITNFKNTRADANRTWANNVDSVQAGYSNYESWVISVSNAGNNLLQQYRSTNKAFRSTKPPKYFQTTHDFGFELKPEKRFRSLSALNITDKEKDRQFDKANKVITTEYNQAIKTLNAIYGDIISGYQEFLSKFK